MAKTGKKQLRAMWLQVHKWIGLTLAILIIPISLTGSALVWHDWLDAKLEPQRHAALGPAQLSSSAYAAAARNALQPGRAAVGAALRKGRQPGRGHRDQGGRGIGPPDADDVWLDPRDATLIDRASGNSGLVQVMHVLHGSLMVPGWGRTIVGWVGAFMFVSCLTGIWLWWPLSGSFSSGFRWKRRNTHQRQPPLFVGLLDSLPARDAFLHRGLDQLPQGLRPVRIAPCGEPGGAAASRRCARGRSRCPATGVDAAVAAASALRHRRPGQHRLADRSESGMEDRLCAEGRQCRGSGRRRTAALRRRQPPQPETLARTMRRWHDGTGMGPVWQIVIFWAESFRRCCRSPESSSGGERASRARRSGSIALRPRPAA